MKKYGNSIMFTDAERLELKTLIDKKYGQVSNSVDYETTSGLHDLGIEGDIYQKSGEMISGSTLERLVGLTSDKRKTSKNTLSKLAKYLDFSSAENLVRYISRTVKKAKRSHQFEFKNLYRRHHLLCIFDNQMEIEMKYLVENSVEIVQATQSVLQKEDRMVISQMEIGRSMEASKMLRGKGANEQNFGPYTSGSNNKIIQISLLKSVSD